MRASRCNRIYPILPVTRSFKFLCQIFDQNPALQILHEVDLMLCAKTTRKLAFSKVEVAKHFERKRLR